jgi:outer membrane receptor for ferrienterochelin and colicins
MMRVMVAVSMLALATAQAHAQQSASQAPAPAAAPVTADPASTAPAPSVSEVQADVSNAHPGEIVVTAHRLNEARAAIQPSLGATSYGVTNATIQALPGGDNQELNQIVLQLPGVVQDGFGQFHVRDDHNGLQYRINGTILPEGIAVFGQTLSPRLIDHFALLTGALPAQYGLRTAGIMDITTKTGFQNGGQLSIYGGSHDWIEPSFEYGGSSGGTNYFVSGDFRHNDIGIEGVDGSRDPLHDKTNQGTGFGYVDHILDADDRVSLLGGYSDQTFQIPDPRGLHPDLGFSVDGQSDYLSNDLDERQHERTAFSQASFLHHGADLTLQASLSARYSSLVYTPDVLGELLFNGQAQAATKHDFAVGTQIEAAYRLGSAHTLRGGIIISRDRSTSDTDTHVFPVDGAGVQMGEPLVIHEADAATEWTYSAYLQDEWKLARTVTFNFGGRFDRYTAYRTQQQFSPRANLVWDAAAGTTVHLGYARYFSPPPFENVATTSVALLNGTSAAPPGTENVTPLAEKQNYFDLGVEQKLGAAVTLSLDGYYRRSRDLIDEGQFGAPIILQPFNYARGIIKGVEANLTYQRGPWLAYGNFAVASARGKDIVTSQFAFNPDDLAYIRDHYIHLDHDQKYTGSAGLSYAIRDGALAGSKFGVDMLYGSGLRTDGATPNGGVLPGYVQVNLSASHKFAGPGIEVRVDVVNVADNKYLIRDGSGIGVGAPQYGPRRGVFVGLTKDI